MLPPFPVCSHPEEVKQIKEYVIEISHFPSWDIESLWERFSDTYCASFLIVDEEILKKFRLYLLEQNIIG
jgi:hypothetical protein